MGDSAKAIQEVAKTTGKVVDATTGVGRFLGKVFGTVPEDIVGLTFGDGLRMKRIERVAIMAKETEAVLRARGITHTVEVSPNLAISLLTHAADESREELRDVWARLMAAAMDPQRAGNVRQSFIEALKHLDPLDARVLCVLAGPPTLGRHAMDTLTGTIHATQDQVFISLDNLKDYGFIANRANYENVALSAMGREVMRVLAD